LECTENMTDTDTDIRIYFLLHAFFPCLIACVIMEWGVKGCLLVRGVHEMHASPHSIKGLSDHRSLLWPYNALCDLTSALSLVLATPSTEQEHVDYFYHYCLPCTSMRNLGTLLSFVLATKSHDKLLHGCTTCGCPAIYLIKSLILALVPFQIDLNNSLLGCEM
jgi:hypothetical protein